MSPCNKWYKTTILWATEVISVKHILVIMVLLMGLPLKGYSQTITVSKIIAASGDIELDSIPTTGGDQFVFIDSATERIRRRSAGRADLPSQLAYEDEANTFVLGNTFNATNLFAANQTFSADIAVNGGDITSTSTLTLRSGGGNLILDPSGNVVFAPDGLSILPNTGYTYNLGALTNKYLTLHAAELWVETLVAQNTIATIGGRVLVGPTTTLTSDLTAGATSIVVKHNQMVSGDRVYMEANGQVEWFAITSAPSGTGPYTYTVTRNLDGSGANAWTAGDAIFNTGTTGKGWIDLYSISGVNSVGVGPTIVGNVRTGTTYNQFAPRWAIGNLNGLYNVATDTYGSAFGDPSGNHILIEPVNGIRFRSGLNTTMQMTGAEINLTNTGVLKSGSATALNTGTGIWMAAGSGTPTFRVGNPASNYLRWDGTSITLDTGLIKIGNNGTQIYAGTAVDGLRGYGFTHTYGALNPGVYYSERIANDGYMIIENVAGAPQSSLHLLVGQSVSGQNAMLLLDADSTTGMSMAEIGAKNYFDLRGYNAFAVPNNNRFRFSLNNSTSNPGYPWMRTDGNDLVFNGDSSIYLNSDVTGYVYTRNTLWTSTGGFATPPASMAGLFSIQSVNSSPLSARAYMGDGTGWRMEWFSRVGNVDTLRFTFDDRGRLGIGNVTPTADLQLANDSAAKPTSSTWTIVSDRRTKRNIQPLESELANIRKLNLVRFEHNGQFGTPNGDKGVGAIADEVEKIFPAAVRTVSPRTLTDAKTVSVSTPFKTMDWHAIFVANVKATQELAAEVERLKQELAKVRK